MQPTNHASYAALCESLISEKGLLCEDVSEMERLLNRIGYRYFAGYARQFQRSPRYGDDRFVEKTTFKQIESIIKLDAELRSLLLKQLGVIEIAVRTALAREYGEKYGDTAFYLNPESYKDSADPAVGAPTAIVSSILLDLENDRSFVVKRYRDPSAEGADFESRRAHAIETFPYGSPPTRCRLGAWLRCLTTSTISSLRKRPRRRFPLLGATSPT